MYRHFIWHSIRKMVHENNVTVLLTASDASDCLMGDIMGYLRNGRLIVEDSPSVLLQSYNVTTISKLLYCVSIADHHITPSDQRTSKLSESMGSIVSGGFTLTTQEVVTSDVNIDVNNKSNQANILIEKKRKCSPLVCEWCLRRIISRSRQRSRFVRIWIIVRWCLLNITRGYMVQLAYLLLPIILIMFYYYSVKDFVQIDLGIGKYYLQILHLNVCVA